MDKQLMPNQEDLASALDEPTRKRIIDTLAQYLGGAEIIESNNPLLLQVGDFHVNFYRYFDSVVCNLSIKLEGENGPYYIKQFRSVEEIVDAAPFLSDREWLLNNFTRDHWEDDIEDYGMFLDV